ncbi:diamine N-acetyltransferase [Methylophilaceae bacterium]|nr:diamine N-acetyltransferase [Methylophilaceae bacterium]
MQLSDLDAVMAIEPEIYAFPWTAGNFRDSLNAGHSCWVYEHGQSIIGYAVLMLVLDEAHLLNISIAKAAQGNGHGRALLDRMMEKAREHGALNLFLEVRVSNKVAIRLYENAGFNEMAIRRKYYPAENGREDAILMGMAL